jgi:hypothetical protein
MGRLMLNILLSFAQFEREVTGERIRDKIAASKRKGMWMGGVPPLGYNVENRRLVPNEREAKVVRHIFQRFVELGSSTLPVKELRLDGVTSKAWTTQDGRVREGKPIDKSLVYKILNNRVYLGEIRHRDQWQPHRHRADSDQAPRQPQGRNPAGRRCRATPSLGRHADADPARARPRPPLAGDGGVRRGAHAVRSGRARGDGSGLREPHGEPHHPGAGHRGCDPRRNVAAGGDPVRSGIGHATIVRGAAGHN